MADPCMDQRVLPGTETPVGCPQHVLRVASEPPAAPVAAEHEHPSVRVAEYVLPNWLHMKHLTDVLTDQLADRLDAFFRDRVPCDGSQESIRRLNEEVPRGPRFS